ncbi:MAG: hypothetical protein A4S09_17310 [Proteobacteria bacterium SG_bin7]|nr:MAG: hypothetical protein A4S09_17310 [Proteobacteria bacterium SG_bin7]
MKALYHQGQQYPTQDTEAGLNYIEIEVSGPTGQWVKTKALIDTGANVTSITAALVEQLGVDDVLPYLGDQLLETANGNVAEPTTKVNIRILGTDGNYTLLQDWPVTIIRKMDEPILGLDILQFYSAQMKHGQIVSMVFDETGPGAIQKRKQIQG